MSESFAGITVPEGDPGGVEGMSSALAGMAGALEGAAARLRALPAGLGGWQGPGSVAFAGACLTTTGGVTVTAEACAVAAALTRRYADQLHHAQQEARAAIRAAHEATDRLDAAKQRLADANARAASAAQEAGLAGTAALTSSLLLTPSAAHAQQAQAEADEAQARADAARASRDIEAAQHDLEQAQARGHRAMEAGRDAASALAGGLIAIGGEPPPPPPPPPAPPKEEHHGLFGSIAHAVTHPGEIVDGVKDFAVDTAKGVGDFAVGLKDVAVMGWKLSPVYGAIDPEGQRQELSQLGQGLSYAIHHPAEFGKTLIDWKDIVGGHPGRAFGQLLPNIALAVATGGGGVAAEGAEGASAVSRLAEGADALEATAGAARGAEGAEAAASASRAGAGAASHVPKPTDPPRVLPGGRAPDGSFIPPVLEGDSVPLSARPRAGDQIQRVYGQPTDAGGLVPTDDFARGWGRSWTPTPIEDMAQPRAHLGLPVENAGRFVNTGELVDPSDVVVRTALPIGDNPGGGLEYLIPNPPEQVRLIGVSGVNPPF